MRQSLRKLSHYRQTKVRKRVILRFESLSSDQSTVALVRLCCKPSVHEVIQNEQYRNCEMVSVLTLPSVMLAKRTNNLAKN